MVGLHGTTPYFVWGTMIKTFCRNNNAEDFEPGLMYFLSVLFIYVDPSSTQISVGITVNKLVS